MYDNYSIRIQRKDGFTLQSVQNVSINTAYRVLPWLVEDLIVRGEGHDPAGQDNHHSTTSEAVRQWFSEHDPIWFNKVADEGYTSIFDLSIYMQHS